MPEQLADQGQVLARHHRLTRGVSAKIVQAEPTEPASERQWTSRFSGPEGPETAYPLGPTPRGSGRGLCPLASQRQRHIIGARRDVWVKIRTSAGESGIMARAADGSRLRSRPALEDPRRSFGGSTRPTSSTRTRGTADLKMSTFSGRFSHPGAGATVAPRRPAWSVRLTSANGWCFRRSLAWLFQIGSCGSAGRSKRAPRTRPAGGVAQIPTSRRPISSPCVPLLARRNRCPAGSK